MKIRDMREVTKKSEGGPPNKVATVLAKWLVKRSY
jgi:hypothetical protein